MTSKQTSVDSLKTNIIVALGSIECRTDDYQVQMIELGPDNYEFPRAELVEKKPHQGKPRKNFHKMNDNYNKRSGIFK